jgi:hypothetical protein
MHNAASDSAPLTAEFLIANARLKFELSCSKESPLKISNRERIAIFHSNLRVRLGKDARLEKGLHSEALWVTASAVTYSTPERNSFRSAVLSPSFASSLCHARHVPCAQPSARVTDHELQVTFSRGV